MIEKTGQVNTSMTKKWREGEMWLARKELDEVRDAPARFRRKWYELEEIQEVNEKHESLRQGQLGICLD